ncbi:uncharacterized protein [Dermacentor albipictus]|uniref:uncharacterized protein n=1 Tax=Dermacentor albipictus TaxID=60249 RepID=UPI0038FC4900
MEHRARVRIAPTPTTTSPSSVPPPRAAAGLNSATAAAAARSKYDQLRQAARKVLEAWNRERRLRTQSTVRKMEALRTHRKQSIAVAGADDALEAQQLAKVQRTPNPERVKFCQELAMRKQCDRLQAEKKKQEQANLEKLQVQQLTGSLRTMRDLPPAPGDARERWRRPLLRRCGSWGRRCSRGGNIRQKFKDFVNRLACVKEENGTKYLILRNEYFEELHNSRRDLSLPSYSAVEEPDNCVGFMCQDQCAEYFSPPLGQTPQQPHQTPQQPQWRHYSPDCPIVANECPPLSPVGVSRIHSSPCLLVEDNCYEDVPPPLPQKKHSFGGSPKRPDMPLPPPRGRKNHGRRGSQVEERVRQFSVEKELEGNVTVKKENIQDVAVSPGTVKEKTQIINRMAESSGAPAKPALPSGSVGNATIKRRDGPGARTAADDDTTSVNTLDPRRREWLLRASQTDYHSLVRLLREDPDLYRFEDFTSVSSARLCLNACIQHFISFSSKGRLSLLCSGVVRGPWDLYGPTVPGSPDLYGPNPLV